MTVLWTASAQQDLKDIHRFIAVDSPQRADEFIRTIHEKAHLIHKMPAMGRPCPALAAGIRSLPIGNYMLFYLHISGTGIAIVRVLHGARDIEHLFGE